MQTKNQSKINIEALTKSLFQNRLFATAENRKQCCYMKFIQMMHIRSEQFLCVCYKIGNVNLKKDWNSVQRFSSSNFAAFFWLSRCLLRCDISQEQRWSYGILASEYKSS